MPLLWLAPLIFGVVLLAALGFGTMLAALNVAYRDFRYVIPFMVQIWMFATPSIYMKTSADAHGLTRALSYCNPVNGLVATFRAACLGDAIPVGAFALSACISASLLLFGCCYFRRAERRFADII